jgi:hypothetical protein
VCFCIIIDNKALEKIASNEHLRTKENKREVGNKENFTTANLFGSDENNLCFFK